MSERVKFTNPLHPLPPRSNRLLLGSHPLGLWDSLCRSTRNAQPIQVAATLFDPHNMRDLNCIPPVQHDQGWALLRSMVIAVIDEVKKSDASTDDSIEDVNDFLVTASAAAAVNSLELSSAEISDREIKI